MLVFPPLLGLLLVLRLALPTPAFFFFPSPRFLGGIVDYFYGK
jgi:hypothetical protein